MPLTQEDRLKGYRSGLEKRKRQQAERRRKARELYAQGVRKSDIARRLNVTPNTIRLDLLEPIDETNDE